MDQINSPPKFSSLNDEREPKILPIKLY